MSCSITSPELDVPRGRSAGGCGANKAYNSSRPSAWLYPRSPRRQRAGSTLLIPILQLAPDSELVRRRSPARRESLTSLRPTSKRPPAHVGTARMKPDQRCRRVVRSTGEPSGSASGRGYRVSGGAALGLTGSGGLNSGPHAFGGYVSRTCGSLFGTHGF